MFKYENNKHRISCEKIILVYLYLQHISLTINHHKSPVQMSCVILHTKHNEAALSYGEVTGFNETMAVTQNH